MLAFSLRSQDVPRGARDEHKETGGESAKRPSEISGSDEAHQRIQSVSAALCHNRLLFCDLDPKHTTVAVGVGGRVMAHGSTLSQYVAKQIATRRPDERDKDPRAAILRHAGDAKDNPYWVTPAYKKYVVDIQLY